MNWETLMCAGRSKDVARTYGVVKKVILLKASVAAFWLNICIVGCKVC